MHINEATEILTTLGAVAEFTKVNGAPQVTVRASYTIGGELRWYSAVATTLVEATKGLTESVLRDKRKGFKETDKFKKVPID